MASRHCCIGLLLLLTLAVSENLVAQTSRGATSESLVRRALPDKPIATRLAPTTGDIRVVVKLREGLAATTRSGRLVGLAGSDIREVSTVLDTTQGGTVANLFSRPSSDLATEKERGEAKSGRELADLSLYFALTYPEKTPAAEVELAIDRLNALAEVEIAYQAPEAHLARVDIAPPTPSYELQQGYLNAAPQGIDSRTPGPSRVAMATGRASSTSRAAGKSRTRI